MIRSILSDKIKLIEIDFFFAAILNIPGLFGDFKRNFKHALPIALNYDHHDPKVQKWITKQINEFYFNNDLTHDKKQNLTNVRLFYPTTFLFIKYC